MNGAAAVGVKAGTNVARPFLPIIKNAVAVILFVIVAYWVFRFIQKKARIYNISSPGDVTFNPAQATISAAQAKTLADAIYTAGQGFGTDEDAIYDAFSQLSNIHDVHRLIAAFGVRPHGNLIFKSDMNLNQFLRYELDAEEMKVINGILQSKNINYSF